MSSQTFCSPLYNGSKESGNMKDSRAAFRAALLSQDLDLSAPGRAVSWI